ncbi:DUF7155 family protein [Mycobacterium sp.]|uniref:DUF7155 family protein n=1 Tax=Mycobacterium sp. TaxID=1785 RepID=UPI002D524407|nr:hypothetical protein [Mycobacterium sp.]HZA10855.1 hypothetical protein [Mycobacterium sp.]
MVVKRAVIVGAFALAAVAAPAVAASTVDSGSAVAHCRAYLGSRGDGICIDGPSDGAPAGVPSAGIGPTPNGGGPGISTSPLFPGQTINTPLA